MQPNDEQAPLLRFMGTARALFWCPGCDEPHTCLIEGPEAWGFNGDVHRPTFTPSVLATRPGMPHVCHSYVTDGQIRFLTDSTHTLAGQTVPLAPWPLPATPEVPRADA